MGIERDFRFFAFASGETERSLLSEKAPVRAGRRPQSMGATSPHFMCALLHMGRQRRTGAIIRTKIGAKEDTDNAGTHLRPQSSHSSTGRQPSRFPHTSHLAPSSVLLKRNSSGLQPPSRSGWRVGLAVPLRGSLMLVRLPPGLMSVKRCTRDTMLEVPLRALPSVAAAIELPTTEDGAVRNESMVIKESVGVGPWMPTARGRAVRSSEPFGLGAGRIVRTEEPLAIVD